MSQRAAREFLDHLTSDDGLRDEVSRALGERARDPAVVLEVAARSGLAFSLDDLEHAFDERYGSRSGELEPAELDQVSGGTSYLLSSTKLIGGAGTISIAFPDVCKTPLPGGPVPIPYPNT